MFDTLDHHILLKRLNITSKALQWFSSYLSDCQQSVTIGSISSKPVPLQSGVPQGSVPGPILFTLYTQPLSNTIQKHQFDYHKYACEQVLFVRFTCNRVYCIHVPGHDPITFSFRSFSFLIGWGFYGPNYLRCSKLCAGPATSLGAGIARWLEHRTRD